jgi:hypothetical protein
MYPNNPNTASCNISFCVRSPEINNDDTQRLSMARLHVDTLGKRRYEQCRLAANNKGRTYIPRPLPSPNQCICMSFPLSKNLTMNDESTCNNTHVCQHALLHPWSCEIEGGHCLPHGISPKRNRRPGCCFLSLFVSKSNLFSDSTTTTNMNKVLAHPNGSNPIKTLVVSHFPF